MKFRWNDLAERLMKNESRVATSPRIALGMRQNSGDWGNLRPTVYRPRRELPIVHGPFSANRPW